MAATGRLGSRFFSRRLYSSGGRVLGEEEKAVENVYIKKMEHEKLEKAARKGVHPEQEAVASKGAPEAGMHPTVPAASSTSGVSTDKNRNYAVLAGTIAILSGFGWYFLSKPKKVEETQD